MSLPDGPGIRKSAESPAGELPRIRPWRGAARPIRKRARRAAGAADVDDAQAAAETRDGQGLAPAVLRAHLLSLQLAGYSENTVYGRRRALARMCSAISVPLLQAGHDDLMAWRITLEGKSAQTISSYVSHAREFYRWAAGEGLCAGNPAVRIPAPRVPRLLPRPIGEQEILAAVAAAPPRVRIMLVLAGWAGLRACEIAGLRRASILDTAQPPVLIIAADATKGSRERIVPLSPFVLEELRRGWLRRGYIIRRRDGQPGPLLAATVSKHCNDHLHDCGIPETLHQLRHRFATMIYRQAHHDLRLVQELMGHASPSTTAGYAAFVQEEAAAAVAALPIPGPARIPGQPGHASPSTTVSYAAG